ncbi:hypothetical protein BDV93DRAFT_527223 [Ceratobasidium sp. AG-I]|nr:hypothetical protein BDV93DRAFT_527223 [Ceratobasidium sp. AG-I]
MLISVEQLSPPWLCSEVPIDCNRLLHAANPYNATCLEFSGDLAGCNLSLQLC